MDGSSENAFYGSILAGCVYYDVLTFHLVIAEDISGMPAEPSPLPGLTISTEPSVEVFAKKHLKTLYKYSFFARRFSHDFQAKASRTIMINLVPPIPEYFFGPRRYTNALPDILVARLVVW